MSDEAQHRRQMALDRGVFPGFGLGHDYSQVLTAE
jgi:hypothetical protein